MAKSSLTWTGPAVTERLKAAQIEGVNATMGASVTHAKNNHDWKNQSTTLEGGINVVDFARPEGTGVRGTWGVNDVVYALIHELGGVIVPVKAKALKIPMPDGSFRFVKSVTIPARPYLRPAADAVYPSLAKRIRRFYEKKGAAGDE